MTLASPLTIKDYLLCRLSAEQETELEELYFADSKRVAEIWAVFAELSEQFLLGELPGPEQSQFELRLQRSPFMRQLFENEKALFDYALANSATVGHSEPASSEKTSAGKIPDGKPESYSRWLERLRSRPLRFALASVSLLLAAGLWLGWQLKSAPTSDRIAVVQDQDAANTQPSRTSFSPSPSPSDSPSHALQTAVATFFLPAQSFRSATEAPVLSIPRQAQTVRLELQLLSGDSPSYSAVLLSESFEPIREWKSLLPQHSNAIDKIVLRVPATLLTESSYVVKLRPMSADAEALTQQFRFTVAKP